MSNSVETIVRVLEQRPFLPESEIMYLAFGYDINNTFESNKKYADMLRRGLQKGLFERTTLKHPSYPKCKYFYYIPETLVVK